MKRITTYILIVLGSFAACAEGLTTGDAAPDFTALDQDGKSWSLKEHLPGKPVVIYFYPAAMTGGCTKQACSYRDYIEQNQSPEIQVVGISGDSPENLKHFQQAERLNFPLLSDPDGKIAESYGVPVTSGEKRIRRTIDGKDVELARSHTASRWTFVVNSDGRIVYLDNQVAAAQDAEKVLAFLRDQQKDGGSE